MERKKTQHFLLPSFWKGVQTRSRLKESSGYALVSNIEPKNIDEALQDNDWILAMEEELNQFTKIEVWDLVPKRKDVKTIGTKWVYKNKLDENWPKIIIFENDQFGGVKIFKIFSRYF